VAVNGIALALSFPRGDHSTGSADQNIPIPAFSFSCEKFVLRFPVISESLSPSEGVTSEGGELTCPVGTGGTVGGTDEDKAT